MNKEMLEMHYHPAKKEVKFRRFQYGKEITIRKDSKLMSYMNKNGDFVLQNYGNKFALDISDVFDGETEIDLKVMTTKEDYEDLIQMIEYFNQDSKCKINPTMLAELEDMISMYSIVEQYGKEAIEILKKHQSSIYNMDILNDHAKTFASAFDEETQKEIESIVRKINSLAENTINLCFTGVYSSGKSSLINAILGYAILPESIESKTSKLFKIQSPKHGASVSVEFCINGHETIILWNESLKHFEFRCGPADSDSRKAIQSLIFEFKESLQHIQLCKILELVNSNSSIDDHIKIYFPIPLDSEQVQFTIYDTPGTDSNFAEHQIVLKKSLSEQTNSILIFVATPDKIEGGGNKALLEYLKEAEQKSDRTCIDIARSLFVINKADIENARALTKLKTAQIKYNNDENISINLADKKLFFTSAKIAYAAKAQANSIATADEYEVIQDDSDKLKRQGGYFLHNHCATSEYATNQMIKTCEDSLSAYQAQKDNSKIIQIYSGLYALENEIKVYGKKYALAVKAYAIIESIDNALLRLNDNVQSLAEQSQKGIDEINNEIASIKSSINETIDRCYKKYHIQESQPIPESSLRFLNLDKGSLKIRLVDELQNRIGQIVSTFLHLRIDFNKGEVEREQSKINQIIRETTSAFTENFVKQQQIYIEQARDSFTTAIKNDIDKNNELSDAAKKFIVQIRKPYVEYLFNPNELEAMYKDNTRSEINFFEIFKITYFDEENFKKDLEKKLLSLATNTADKFKKDVRKNHEEILKKLKAEFTQNTDRYSTILKAKYEDKEVMTSIHKKIFSAASDLSKCQQEFNSVVWRAKKP